MSRTIFRKPTAFSKWILIFAGLGLALLVPGFLGGKEFVIFFGCLGGVWIMVAMLVAVVVAFAGKGQVAELSMDGETLTVRTVGPFRTRSQFCHAAIGSHELALVDTGRRQVRRPATADARLRIQGQDLQIAHLYRRSGRS